MNSKLPIILLLGIFIFISFISAVPKIEPYVNDFADILTTDQESSLNLLADIIEQNTTYEIAIVTVLNTEGQDRVLYANQIGDENGVGKKDKNNGIVVLWSMDNEKGGAIANGRYSESIITDSISGRIGREARDTYFDKENYYDGFYFILIELNKEIIKDSVTNLTLSGSDNQDSSDKLNWFYFFPLSIIIIFWLIRKFSRYWYGTSDYSSSSSSSSSSSGGSGKSSGGGSFGGGSFGGAGANF